MPVQEAKRVRPPYFISSHSLSLSLSRPGRVRIEVLADMFFFSRFVGVYTIITILVLAFPRGELASYTATSTKQPTIDSNRL